MDGLKIAAVSYINTLPFLNGLESLGDDIELHVVPPAQCAQLLEDGLVDIALCPVGALPEMDQWYCLTDYCIGCDGPVRTVSVFSDYPLTELKSIVLSAESRTSNLLVQVLDKNYWKLGLEFLKPGEYRDIQGEKRGYLYIGDSCFQKESEFAYREDLGEAWKEYCGLPFAFACWISLSEPDVHTEAILNSAFARGIKSIPDIKWNHPGIDYKSYLTNNISYDLNDSKKKALLQFLDEVRSLSGAAFFGAVADLRQSGKNR